jgi:hypothetical protein
MLLAVPFTAQLIPAKPLKSNEDSELSDKHSDEDSEIDEDEENPNSTDMTKRNGSAAPQPQKRKRVIPFFLVWKLLVNPVSEYFHKKNVTSWCPTFDSKLSFLIVPERFLKPLLILFLGDPQMTRVGSD